MNTLGGAGLWDEEEGFYYDHLLIDGRSFPLRIRSMVGIVPLFAVESLEEDLIERLPGFRKRLKWFLENRRDLAQHISYMESNSKQDGKGVHPHRLLAIPSRHRLERVLRYVLDEDEFFSPFGVRSLSRVHHKHPYVLHEGQAEYRVEYTPGEATSGIFGGNSNWRGPVWFPVNYLLVESLERYHHFYGDSLKVECPTGSGQMMNLAEVASELRRRLTSIFSRDREGHAAWQGNARKDNSAAKFASDPHWRDLVLFHEYFHGDTGRGLGASHQTGWTGLVAPLMKK